MLYIKKDNVCVFCVCYNEKNLYMLCVENSICESALSSFYWGLKQHRNGFSGGIPVKISEFAKRFDISINTVRYYVSQGLLLPEVHNKQYLSLIHI